MFVLRPALCDFSVDSTLRWDNTRAAARVCFLACRGCLVPPCRQQFWAPWTSSWQLCAVLVSCFGNDHFCWVHLQDAADGEDDGLAAYNTLRTLATVLESVSSKPALFPQVGCV